MFVCIAAECKQAECVVAHTPLFTCVSWVGTGQLFGGHSTPAMGYGGVQLPPGRDYSIGRGTGGGGFSGQRKGSYGGGRSDRPSIGRRRNNDRRDQRPPLRSGGGDRRHDDANRRRDSGRGRGRSSNRMGAGAGRGPGGGSGPNRIHMNVRIGREEEIETETQGMMTGRETEVLGCELLITSW